MAIAEGQQCLLEEAQYRLLTWKTLVMEFELEVENYDGARSKTT